MHEQQLHEEMHEQTLEEDAAEYGELAEEEDAHSPAWSPEDEMDHHHHHDDEDAASSSACYYSPFWRDPRGSSRGRDY
jgi:hypothetical protein